MCQRRQNSVIDCDRYGESKFFLMIEAEEEGEADGDVRVAAEVEVDLEGVADEPVPGVGGPERAGAETGVGDLAAGVGDQDLLREAEADERDSASEPLRRMDAADELVREVAEPDDRARHEMRKHRDVAGEVREVPARRGLPAVDVDRVAERLEGIEADAERQRDAEGRLPGGAREAESADEPVEALDAEVEVLEKPEHREVGDDRDDDRAALEARPRSPDLQLRNGGAPGLSELPGDDEADRIVHGRRPEHQEDEERVRPAVEKVGEERQDEVPGGAPARRSRSEGPREESRRGRAGS